MNETTGQSGKERSACDQFQHNHVDSRYLLERSRFFFLLSFFCPATTHRPKKSQGKSILKTAQHYTHTAPTSMDNFLHLLLQ